MEKLNFKEKIITADKLVEALKQFKQDGKKIVYCHGVFDLLHRGHINQFEQARVQGDILVVGLTTDKHVKKGPGRPVFSQNIRAEVLAALELVDFVVFSDNDSAVEMINYIKPDVYVKGKSYEDAEKDISGRMVLESKAVKALGGTVFYSVELPMHSTPLLNNFIDPYPAPVLEFLSKFKEKYNFDEVAGLVDDLSRLKVLVFGEIILDQYDYVEAMDSSPKSGIVSLRHIESETHAGGSLACANHIVNFCDDVTLLSVIGRGDTHNKYIDETLNAKIKRALFDRDNFSVLIKKREIDRIYFQKRTETYLAFNDSPTPADIEDKIISYLKNNIKSFDLVLTIDYGHGLITKKVADFLSAEARVLAVNTQTNSANKGLHVITRYPRADYACLDHFEAKLALRDKFLEPELIGRNLLDSLGSRNVMITLGHNGSVVVSVDGGFYTPVFSKKIVDTVGAGDALFSVTSLSFANKWPVEVLGFMGNVVGALATTYIGNKGSVTKSAVLNFISSLMA